MQKRWIWPFEVEEQIGAGGMGQVFRARYVKNDKRVALKLLPEDIAENQVISARFERELEILKDMRHPNIVHCFGGTCDGSQRFYAMELVEGGTVESELRHHGRLTAPKVVEYGLQICSALAYAHARGVIHRDLKPGNLLLTADGKLKLGDFGLALIATENKLTAAGKTMGTLHYMAPEQIRGAPPLSSRTDLYALGCVFFEMLTGRPPFIGEAAGEILHQHIHVPAPKVRTLATDCPVALEEIVSDLLEKDPEVRPKDAVEVGQRLQQIGKRVEMKPARTPTSPPSMAVAPTRPVMDSTPTAPPAAPAAAPGFSLNLWTACGALLFCVMFLWAFAAWAQMGLYSKSEALWVTTLNDANPVIREVAAKALGEIGYPARNAVPELIARLDDEDFRVRSAAVVALGKIGAGAKSAATPLKRVQQRDEQPFVRDEVSAALEQINHGHTPASWPWILGFGIALGLIAFGVIRERLPATVG
ncbi:MAG TPA: protein kinase [Planctomycetaceae bacterium]|nr:protein kinase [Planctomycetaceae bacterium]